MAAKEDGIVVSNDHFRDLKDESPEFLKTVNQRLLPYCFSEDYIILDKRPPRQRIELPIESFIRY